MNAGYGPRPLMNLRPGWRLLRQQRYTLAPAGRAIVRWLFRCLGLRRGLGEGLVVQGAEDDEGTQPLALAERVREQQARQQDGHELARGHYRGKHLRRAVDACSLRPGLVRIGNWIGSGAGEHNTVVQARARQRGEPLLRRGSDVPPLSRLGWPFRLAAIVSVTSNAHHQAKRLAASSSAAQQHKLQAARQRW